MGCRTALQSAARTLDLVSVAGGPGKRGEDNNRGAHQRGEAVAGAAARAVAVFAISGVLQHGRTFDDALATGFEKFQPAARDRAFARAIAAAVLRNRGALVAVLSKFMDKGWPKDAGPLEPILLAAAAQLLVLETPPHAAISLAVEQCRHDSRSRRFDKLANAVLRRVSERGAEIFRTLEPARLTVPAWMLDRWRSAYGDETALAVARASLEEAPLDLSVKSDAEAWATKLGGTLLATGTVRLMSGGRVEDLAGFADGAWWVQDAAAALPVKLLGDVRGLDIADLCAAPGGKTAQLASRGARVTAVEQSAERMARLRGNLARLKLEAETVVADAAAWQPGRMFDAVLADAPCTATGTIRRHPDILYLKRPEDIAALASKQAAILASAARLVKPGGQLLYCTCSLEPEEGPDQIAAFLARNPGYSRRPIDPQDIGSETGLLTRCGDLRTFPQHFRDFPPGLRGMDGFYAALLVRNP